MPDLSSGVHDQFESRQEGNILQQQIMSPSMESLKLCPTSTVRLFLKTGTAVPGAVRQKKMGIYSWQCPYLTQGLTTGPYSSANVSRFPTRVKHLHSVLVRNNKRAVLSALLLCNMVEWEIVPVKPAVVVRLRQSV